MPPSPSPPRPRRLPGQPPEYKHFCRVCNKGFTCSSALGGHMRAHGASDGFGAADDDSPAADELAVSARCRGGSGDDQCEAVAATHAYALRANSNRLIRSCQVCKNCGKEFTSWELFLQHGKCSSEDEEEEAVDGLLGGSLRSSSPSSNGGGGDAQEDPAVAAAWSKGKRSRRVNLMVAGDDSISTPAGPAVMPSSQRGGVGASGEEEDLANCLVMLSSSSNIVIEQPNVARIIDRQEPACASTSKLHDDERPSLHAQPISFFAPAPKPAVVLPSAQYTPPASSRNLFECKACKKVFTSHQALGGHRASHKKVKGCFAAKFDTTSANETAAAATTNPPSNNGINNSKGAAAVEQANNVVGANADDRTRSVYATAETDTTVGTTSEAVAASLSMALAPLGHDPLVTTLAVAAPGKKNTKMHECSVCHRLFSSGQALGGHKRCHWLTSGTADPCNPVANMIPPLTEDLVGVVRHQLTLRPMVDAPEPALDLTIAANPLAPPAAGITAQPEAGSSSCFRLDAIAPVNLQPLAVAVPSTARHRKKTTGTSSHHATADAVAEDDEADSTAAKRAKLSDLKDVVSMDGEPTEPWLQVGIGSSSAGGDDKQSRNSAT